MVLRLVEAKMVVLVDQDRHRPPGRPRDVRIIRRMRPGSSAPLPCSSRKSDAFTTFPVAGVPPP